MHSTTVCTRRQALAAASTAVVATSAGLLTLGWAGAAGATGSADGANGAGSADKIQGKPQAPQSPQPDPVLHGVSDIHIHAAPDTRPRSVNELSMARAARDAGYRAVMFKSNHFACHDRAYLVNEALAHEQSMGGRAGAPPKTGAETAAAFTCFGSLCMNKVHGDRVNVHAAEQAVNTTGKLCRCIWMPTQDAAYQHQHEKRPGKGIAVLDDTGAVLPEVVRVMEICAEADIIFATGHCSPVECLVLARKAKEVGVGKFVVTHANSLIWKLTREQILRAVEYGAFIEYSYLCCLWGPGSAMPNFPRMSQEEFVHFARIAPERTVITTDLGQENMPHPLEGMRQCIGALRKAGMTQEQVDGMTRRIPAQLMGL